MLAGMVIPKIASPPLAFFLQHHATAELLVFSMHGPRVRSPHSQISQFLLSLTLASFGKHSQLVLMLMLELATFIPTSQEVSATV